MLTATATDNESIPPGDGYVGTLKAIAETTGKFGDVYDWTFLVDGPDGAIEVSRRTSRKFTPMSIARQFAEGLLGREVNRGEAIDLEALVGKSVSLTIETNANGYSSIVDVMPAGSATEHVTADSIAF